MGLGAETKRNQGLPVYAGPTDVAAGNVVRWTPGKNWTVQNVATTSQEPVGVARASARSGAALDVRDLRDVVRGVAAATIAAGTTVGVASVAATEGASGAIQLTQLGPVGRASGTAVWAIGVAVESANPGESFGYYIDRKELSGLA